MPRPQRNLRLIDADSGELIETDCPGCAERDLTYKELERKHHGLLRDLGKLRAELNRDDEKHKLWGEAVALWWEWKIATNRMRCEWSHDRFELVKPFLAHDGWHRCRYAVWGIAAHPNTKQITPSYIEVYNDWELCFRNRGTFERYANRGAAIFGRELPPAPGEMK